MQEKALNENLKLNKKPIFPVSDSLRKYLKNYGRETKLNLNYDDLLRAKNSFPLFDKHGKDTLWETMMYEPAQLSELNRGLTHIYSLLKSDGDDSVIEHLYVERIDYCTFGNSNPFRIRIVNNFNDNYDYFYVKKADSSRIYGLELEDILSPNRINYLVEQQTMIEEHIAGIPGDQFRIAKEFVKFNERCFVRLLGDMRAYNYVVDVTPDFEDEQYRIRAIDFDQQSYEDRRSLYLPQFFKDNMGMVKVAMDVMTSETVKQYQHEERSLIAKRLKADRHKIKDLLDTMRKDKISSDEKINLLKDELINYHNNTRFNTCKTMGDIVRMNLNVTLTKPKGAK
jgi:hypothetical protein